MSAILFLLKKSIQNLWCVVLIWVSEADPLILGFGCLVPFGFPLRPDKRTRGMKRNSMRLPKDSHAEDAIRLITMERDGWTQSLGRPVTQTSKTESRKPSTLLLVPLFP